MCKYNEQSKRWEVGRFPAKPERSVVLVRPDPGGRWNTFAKMEKNVPADIAEIATVVHSHADFCSKAIFIEVPMQGGASLVDVTTWIEKRQDVSQDRALKIHVGIINGTIAGEIYDHEKIGTRPLQVTRP
jgi:hypothetical protein